jgi:hypothetical protein
MAYGVIFATDSDESFVTDLINWEFAILTGIEVVRSCDSVMTSLRRVSG